MGQRRTSSISSSFDYERLYTNALLGVARAAARPAAWRRRSVVALGAVLRGRRYKPSADLEFIARCARRVLRRLRLQHGNAPEALSALRRIDRRLARVP